ncbi:enoyl-CoA hydratase/isomerase family protein [Leifsonia aquatica]|uniref:enoyl-CoA hydratase/isomerase family protein n=1 Tax=Leifsonia aquatica TaxID=144185 RepID=UPI00384C1391
MSTSAVYLTFDGEAALITLDRPGGNRIDFAMREQILQSVRAVAASGARVLIVQAIGPDFCLGGDAREWAGLPTSALKPRIAVYLTALRELQDLPIPTVAVVQGRCRGGGFELALSCDFICAARTADFAFPESRLGIMTLQGGVVQLSERIGRTRALEMTTLSDPVSATQLSRWNVVNWVVDEGALDREARRVAGRLAASAPAAFAATKSLLTLRRLGGAWAADDQLYRLSMPLFEDDSVQAALAAAETTIE